MLRITIREQGNVATIQLEGRLVGPWVEELKQCWENLNARSKGKIILADLHAVTFVDASGKALLQKMRRSGTRLSGRGVLITQILDEIEQSHAN